MSSSQAMVVGRRIGHSGFVGKSKRAASRRRGAKQAGDYARRWNSSRCANQALLGRRRSYDTGRAYLWEFLDPLSDGSIGYARFRFSYASLLPEAAERPVFFEGMSCFRLRDGLIAHYGEAFDRGVALVQLEFSAERIKHILARAATAQNRNPETKRHLHRFSAG
jgi:hypothetical protein